MSDHNNEDKASASHVVPPTEEYKSLILEQLLKEIDEETARAKTSHGVYAWIIREHQKDFPWINWNMVDYFSLKLIEHYELTKIRRKEERSQLIIADYHMAV